MYDEQQDRPPWLRNLRPRHEVEAAPLMDAPMLEPIFESGADEAALESSPAAGGLNRRHLLLLALLLWANVAILGCLCLLATRRVVP
jgi:hypothetical protein